MIGITIGEFEKRDLETGLDAFREIKCKLLESTCVSFARNLSNRSLTRFYATLKGQESSCHCGAIGCGGELHWDS